MHLLYIYNQSRNEFKKPPSSPTKISLMVFSKLLPFLIRFNYSQAVTAPSLIENTK